MTNSGSVVLEFIITLSNSIVLIFISIMANYTYSLKSWLVYQNLENIVCVFANNPKINCKSRLISGARKFNRNINLSEINSTIRKNIIKSSFTSVIYIKDQPLKIKVTNSLDFKNFYKKKKADLWFFY